MVSPVLCIFTSATSPYVRVCFFCFCDLRRCLPLGLFCRPCPTSSTMERWFCFYFVFQLCVSAPFSSSCSCPVFRVVLYCRPSVSPSYGYVIGLIVPANSNLVPSGLDLRPERMSISVSCYYSFHAFLSFPFCFVLFFALFCPSFCSSLSSSISVVRIYHR